MPSRSHPVPVPNSSGHYNAWTNSFSTKCGTLTPCMCKEVFPGDERQLDIAAQVQLPPMATDFYGRVEARFEAFFVPNRLLWAGWKDFITDKKSWPKTLGAAGQPLLRPTSLPRLYQTGVLADDVQKNFSAGSLADYLGCRISLDGLDSATTVVLNNVLPFVAYARVYDDWYRNPRIQTPLFAPHSLVSTATNYTLAHLPYISVDGGDATPWSDAGPTISLTDIYFDGTNVFTLRQRNWDDDYFTTCTYEPQAGDDTAVGITLDENSGEFTISSLRAANSLQQWKERNNVAGPNYDDQIFARFGVRPADAFSNRAVYLGSYRMPVYNKSVYQSSRSLGEAGDANPFSSVGSKYANSVGSGSGNLFGRVGGNFKVTEHGFIMVIFSLVPIASYASGVERMFNRRVIGDIPDPMLQSVGQQAIYQYELNGARTAAGFSDAVYGYNDRYIELNEYKNEVHGLLRDGSSLDAFALQRSFTGSDTSPDKINSEMIQIPIEYLDQVCATAQNVSKFGCWVDCAFSERKISKFVEYAIPTLGLPANSHMVDIPDGGSKI